jgi:exodeoxyribonuclease V alpha subunit
MNGDNGLSPLGTARSAVGQPAAGVAFPEALRETVREYDLPAETVTLAWEIAKLAREAAPGQKSAVLTLALAVLIAARQGSLRVPLGGTGSPSRDQAYLDALAARLGVSGADLEAVKTLLEAARNSGGSPSAGPIPGVLGRPGEYVPLIVEGGYLYAQRMLFYEDRLSASLRARMTAPELEVPASKIEEALADLLARPTFQDGKPVRLSEEQQSAMRAALSLPLAVVSGGPGTGKTSVVLSILRALVRLGVPVEAIALAAPTGKAANRMEESIRKGLSSIPKREAPDEALLAGFPEPQTIHRLLGSNPAAGRFRHHENNPLSERVVVVDECSMIDLFLMDQLMRSVAPRARLVLLGDADQLPSVEAGAIFRDLIPAPDAPASDPRNRAVVRLTRSYRMDPSGPAGGAILQAAAAVNSGEGERLFAASGKTAPLVAERSSVAELTFEKLEILGNTAASREDFLDRWFEDRIRGLPDFDRLVRKEYHFGLSGFSQADRDDIGRLRNHFDAFRILCVTRGAGRPTGAEAVNAALHARALAARPASEDSATVRPAFLPGEPVMMLRNDYDRGLFNGDQGIVLRVSEPESASHRFMAVFPRGEDSAIFHLDTLRPDLELAYAVTVHKAQGSEYDYVGLVLPETDLPLLTRELLYTAMTRSRKSVVILGEKELLKKGIQARIERSSGIGEKLVLSNPDSPARR